jgi:hypothetical protein
MLILLLCIANYYLLYIYLHNNKSKILMKVTDLNYEN